MYVVCENREYNLIEFELTRSRHDSRILTVISPRDKVGICHGGFELVVVKNLEMRNSGIVIGHTPCLITMYE